ncbi:flavin reductase family protein [Arthrobacter sp. MYb213]|uniref:flavin reductase family protein n=1 Tax=Arthrobacter sp. MYb213 TaxID=1848595 RepID=UPI0015E3AC1D|nr:flavin reductase family protein [Arthrobacter sp. MYb213]
MTIMFERPQALEASSLRRAMGRIPTSVAVVTGHGPDGPVGMTVGSLATVSLDPPLVTFFAMKNSRSFAVLSGLERICINVLDEDQTDVCFAFASSTGSKFEAGDWDLASESAPVLKNAAVSMECSIDSVFDAGDHYGLMARLTSLQTADSRPLVFYRGLISRLHPNCGRQAKTNRLDWWAQ